MLLSVDESGDFRSRSDRPQLFVAAHVREGKIDQHVMWERKIPRRLKDARGEIKSSALSDEHLDQFIEEVLFREPRVRITAVVVVPGHQPSDAVEHHRVYSLATLNDSQVQMLAIGNAKGARSVGRMGDWLRKMSQPVYLKTISMAACVSHALRDAVLMAAAGGYDEELGAIEYRIDRDFVRQPEHKAYVTQLFRVYLETEMVGGKAIPSLDSWDEKTHPFLIRYSGRLPNGQPVWDMTRLFRDRCQFVESRSHAEVRVADCVATIIRRAYLNDAFDGLVKRIHPLFAGPRWPVVIQLGNSIEPQALARKPIWWPETPITREEDGAQRS